MALRREICPRIWDLERVWACVWFWVSGLAWSLFGVRIAIYFLWLTWCSACSVDFMPRALITCKWANGTTLLIRPVHQRNCSHFTASSSSLCIFHVICLALSFPQNGEGEKRTSEYLGIFIRRTLQELLVSLNEMKVIDSNFLSSIFINVKEYHINYCALMAFLIWLSFIGNSLYALKQCYHGHFCVRVIASNKKSASKYYFSSLFMHLNSIVIATNWGSEQMLKIKAGLFMKNVIGVSPW